MHGGWDEGLLRNPSVGFHVAFGRVAHRLAGLLFCLQRMRLVTGPARGTAAGLPF